MQHGAFLAADASAPGRGRGYERAHSKIRAKPTTHNRDSGTQVKPAGILAERLHPFLIDAKPSAVPDKHGKKASRLNLSLHVLKILQPLEENQSLVLP